MIEVQCIRQRLSTDELKQRGDVFFTADKMRAIVLLPKDPIAEIWNGGPTEWVFGTNIHVEFVPLLTDALKRALNRYKSR